MATQPGKRSLAVYEAPPIPDGWHRGEIVRIVDPLGTSAGWVSPVHAGALIAAWVRPTPRDAWVALLAAPDSCDAMPGCELLVRNRGGWAPVGNSARGWTFASRDPTAVTASGRVDQRLVSITTRCDDGIQIEIDADDSPGLGIRLRFRPQAASIERGASGEVNVRFQDSPVAAAAIRPGRGWSCAPTGGQQVDSVPDGREDSIRSSVIVVVTAQFARAS